MPPQVRSSLHSLPRDIPLRPDLHRGGHHQLHRERAPQLRQDEDGKNDDDAADIVPARVADCPRHPRGPTVPADPVQDRPHPEGRGLPAGPQQETER